MKELKNFMQFLNENADEVQDIQVETDNIQDEYNIESEEETDILELKYNKETEEWDIQGELDNPDDFEDFYEWFENIDEDNPLISMKEDDEEVVFFIPEDIYVKYLEGDLESEEDDIDPNDWDDDDYDEED